MNHPTALEQSKYAEKTSATIEAIRPGPVEARTRNQ